MSRQYIPIPRMEYGDECRAGRLAGHSARNCNKKLCKMRYWGSVVYYNSNSLLAHLRLRLLSDANAAPLRRPTKLLTPAALLRWEERESKIENKNECVTRYALLSAWADSEESKNSYWHPLVYKTGPQGIAIQWNDLELLSFISAVFFSILKTEFHDYFISNLFNT